MYILRQDQEFNKNTTLFNKFNNSRGCKNHNFFLIYVAQTNQEKIKKQKTQIEGYNLWLDLLWYQLMQILAELNGIHKPKIYLIQVCWK
jgi:hypothetical protein